MAKHKIKSGGGLAAIRYSYGMARKSGGIFKLYRALKRPNTCKTCAFGMGGLKGGMVNEIGQSLQLCKKSLQAQAQDMQGGIPKDFFYKNSAEDLSKLSGRELEALGRLVHPLYLPEGASHFQILSWPEAIEKLKDNWRQASPDRSFFYTSGRSSMEAAYLVQLLARQWGTNHVNNCSYYCHQASGVGLGQSLGGGTSTVQLQDLRQCDLVVLIGANPASNHPRMMTFLKELRRRGGHVVVINPYKELALQHFRIPSDLRSLLFDSEIATSTIQPHCGGDLALLKAAAVLLWREQKVDSEFVRNHCNDVEAFAHDLETEDVEHLLAKSGVALDDVQTLCNFLSKSKKTIFAWAMGITHHRHGVENVRAIANLALLRGMIGKPGAGLLPIRGHSNVQGVGSVGVVPKLKPEIVASLLSHFDIQEPKIPGMDTFSCMQAAHKGNIDFTMLIGGNLYAANPDLTWAAEALNRIQFTVFLSTTLNLGHIYGHGKNTLILPVRARDEEKQNTSQESMFNYIRLSQGGQKAPAGDVPAESEILVKIGAEFFTNGKVPWDRLGDHHEVRTFIAKTVPNLQQMERLDSGAEFTIPQRIKHTPHFNTENGNANLAVLSAPDARPQPGHFNLMTFRSEGQFNTIIYEDEDIYRGVEHRSVVFMNHADISENGLREGDRVFVESRIGKMPGELIEAPIRAGNVAMYYPEANAIVPAEIDPLSKTPVFKSVPVKIHKIKQRSPDIL
ncbi:MAG: FdhF/YdeP family oxidoreductase [bacterium]